MSEAAAVVLRPWEEPFWKPAKGRELVLAYLVLIHVLGIVGLVLYPIPSPPVLAITLVAAMLGGLGTTVCFHRMLAHRTVKLNPVLENFLIFFTIFNGSGNPTSWVAFHRRHHARSDTPDDISSPKHGGFWWAHLRWLYQNPPESLEKWAPDLNKPVYRFWTRMETPIVVGSLLCGLLFGWEGFFWMGALRMVYSLHGQCAVNSLTHMGEHKGDSSKNLWWLGPLQLAAWGENWHRNHHSQTNSARFGWKWWEVDIGWYFIRAMAAMGLASDVKVPKKQLEIG